MFVELLGNLQQDSKIESELPNVGENPYSDWPWCQISWGCMGEATTQTWREQGLKPTSLCCPLRNKISEPWYLGHVGFGYVWAYGSLKWLRPKLPNRETTHFFWVGTLILPRNVSLTDRPLSPKRVKKSLKSEEKNCDLQVPAGTEWKIVEWWRSLFIFSNSLHFVV